ncbi:MAG: hypothetical protein COS07_00370 [Candidatus Aenigmarchaeota archaeon CG01_land_8_20_14_3_00_37_9]|nr:MAG: hypothetical protein COS07_00370 [Candidatus Aenigmarchaeota archaeon CG01_land_8_20_14_3_00_37_9]
MGKIKHLNEVRSFLKKTPVANSRDIRLIVKNDNYAHLIVRNMVKRGEIKKLKKGYYTIYEDPALSVLCFKPSYIGLQNALSIHDIWKQETNVVIVTSKEVRVGKREVFGQNVILHRIKPSLLFGFELVKFGEFYLPVSDLEKTLIDLFYFKEYLNADVLKNIISRMNKKKFM